MADDPGANKSADQSTQQEPVPSSDQQAPESKTAEVTPKGQDQGVQESEPKLPEDAKERTKEQFEKLKSQLAEERQRRTAYERMVNQMPRQDKPAAPEPPQTQRYPDWYNPDTGEVQVDVLSNRMSGLESQLQQANRTIQSFVKREDDRQAKAAFKTYPELNPSGDNFNEDFHKAVVGYLANAYAEGRSPTMKQAADTIKSIGVADVKKAEGKGAKQALEKLTPKEQAALEAEGRSDKRPGASMQDLQERTRRGDDAAIMERLKNIPPVGR
jgi:hypothetical protein